MQIREGRTDIVKTQFREQREVLYVVATEKEQEARDAWALLFTCPVSPKDSFFFVYDHIGIESL